MKKYVWLVLVAVTALFSSCLKSDYVDPYQQAEEQLKKDEEIIKRFIADNNINAVRHESGMYYQVINAGTGNFDYRTNSNPNITVNYTGRLLNGNVFDSNTLDNVRLGNLIIGWRLGIPLIQKGGEIRLLIPSLYAYGPSGRGSIPPNAVLDFNIELTQIQ
ncbi:putative FKBP-type peptidyl-prolyl cis-trans isomerase [Pedobacter glucosidilyticus]|nr:FKBP-type peptidyl-prolyl cis-trans isomerase [Pedobacter glucosidilyticus]KHJ38574.1 putative FKBP-type peptidyl-prolyl cis-trans isomerase [Pedobacter glucosidilyticus]